MTHISEALAVPARRMAMVGDSAVDMATGRSAGAAICVGVTEGGGDPVGADVLIRTVEEVEPVDE